MSCYTEHEIMEFAIKVVEEYGEINTTDLKEILNDVMKPSGEDLYINLNRNDTKFDQKVRNMVSHRDSNDLYKYFSYRREGRVGVLTSKSIVNKHKGISETNSKNTLDQDTLLRIEKKKEFNARKVDFEELNRSNKEIGDLGEKFVLNYEIERLDQEIACKVRHVSKEDGDGAGYDILSYNTLGEIRFLEVKTTKGSLETPFFLSENERLFLETYKNEAEIVRVYNFDMEKQVGQIHRISGSDFIDKINLKAVAYRASFK